MSDKKESDELNFHAFLAQLNLMDLALFDQVARQLNLSRAAEKLGEMPESTASRRLRRLEELFSSRLFERTRRKFTLTDPGEAYLQQVDAILGDIRELHRMTSDVRTQTTGPLKVSAGLFVAEILGREFLGRFVRDHPDIALDMKQIRSPAELEAALKENDLILSGILPESKDFGLRRLAPFRIYFWANREYLERFGRPEHPQDLEHHRIITMRPYACYWENSIPWEDADGKVHKQPLQNPTFCETASSLINMTTQGVGITCAPLALVQNVRDELEVLFDGHYGLSTDLYAIFPSARLMPQKVALFLEELESFVKQLPTKV